MNCTDNYQTLQQNSDTTACTQQAVILPCEKEGEYFVEKVTLEKKPLYDFLKRAFDIIASGLAMILLALPLLVVAIVVKCTSPGTALYSQDRLGLNGKKIRIIKFRSMVMDAEKNGAQWSNGENDSRITPVGSFLRKYRIDELPQLWCIFKGDLSIVGPRPERECFYNEFETYVHGFSERMKVKPGLTGLAQINGGYNLKPEEKIVYDVEYIKNRSMLLDLKIIFKTVGVVLKKDGAK
ncbi:MAG: sugar transferase [Clostridia bacterium]|nr:sugar transferase [Clostridia bacterium]